MPQLREFADEHGLALVSIADLIRYRRAHRVAGAAGRDDPAADRVRRRSARSATATWSTASSTSPWSAATSATATDVLVRVHSECLTGDVFGSLRCDCGAAAATPRCGRSSPKGRGVVVYLRGHEGRGIGLLHKLQAYSLQDGGRDTVDANLDLGLPADARDYGTGAQILHDLGVALGAAADQQPGQARRRSRATASTVAERVPLPVRARRRQPALPATKRDRMGHDLDDAGSTPASARPQRSKETLSSERSRTARRSSRRTAAACGSRVVAAHLARDGDGRAGRRRAARALDDVQGRVTGVGARAGVLRAAGRRGSPCAEPASTRSSRSASSIRGGTPHFDYVCRRGDRRADPGRARHRRAGRLRRAHLRRRRSRRWTGPASTGSQEDKGYEAAHAALSHRATLHSMRGRPTVHDRRRGRPAARS